MLTFKDVCPNLDAVNGKIVGFNTYPIKFGPYRILPTHLIELNINSTYT